MLRFKKVNTVIEVMAQITAEDIRKKFRLPANAVVYVKTPGGGDCSGQALKVGVDIEFIEVSYEVRKAGPVKTS